MFDVFVCHSPADNKKAMRIVEALEAEGVRCWVAPRNIVPGGEYAEETLRGIEHSQLFLLVFSEHTNDSPQINREVERAVHHGMKVIPFRLKNIAPSRNLEYFISTPQWLDAFSGSFDSHLRYLNRTVKHLLNDSTGSMPPVRTGVYRIEPEKKQAAPSKGPSAPAPQSTARSKLVKIAIALILVGVAVSLLPSLGTQRSELDPKLTGTWQLAQAGNSLSGTETIHPDASYELTMTFQELGGIEFRNGWAYLIPRTGIERRLDWQPQGERTALASVLPREFWDAALKLSPERGSELHALSGQLSEWERVPLQPSSDGASASALNLGVSRWQLKIGRAYQFPWDVFLETGPGAAYKIEAAHRETGGMEAANGSWNMRVKDGATRTGSYRLLSDTSLLLETPVGQFSAQRTDAGN